MAKIPITCAALVALASVAGAQPRVSNGEVRPAAVDGRIDRAFLQRVAPPSGTAWIGYAVPVIEGDRRICCGNSHVTGRDQGCRLEPQSSEQVNVQARGAEGPVRLEGSDRILVLFRVERGVINKIRMVCEDCALDGGGLTLYWLTGVSGEDSAVLLASLADGSSPDCLAESALSALAMHRDPSALAHLISAARSGTTKVRGQALFWLSQRAGDRAIGAISEALARDPDTEVKRHAVFALSQLPKEDGVPLLVQVARTNTNPLVRKQAMFWLGQSKDPRALRFFEEILFK